MFTVCAGYNSTIASVVWICLPAEAVAATYTGLSLISKSWSLCANSPSVLLIWVSVLERSSKWSRDWLLLPLREEASSVGSEMSHWCLCCSALNGPLWWRWRALLDNSPVKVHEDYWAEHIKAGHTNNIAHHPGSSATAGRRKRDGQHKQTSFVLAVLTSKLLLQAAGFSLSCSRLSRACSSNSHMVICQSPPFGKQHNLYV